MRVPSVGNASADATHFMDARVFFFTLLFFLAFILCGCVAKTVWKIFIIVYRPLRALCWGGGRCSASKPPDVYIYIRIFGMVAYTFAIFRYKI